MSWIWVHSICCISHWWSQIVPLLHLTDGRVHAFRCVQAQCCFRFKTWTPEWALMDSFCSTTFADDFVCFSVIHDAREWRYFKMLYNVTTPVEEQLFNTGTTGDQPQIFLHPKENVHVPFRFLTFRADHSVPDQAPSDPYGPFSQTAGMMSHKKNVIKRLESHSIKVIAQWLVFDCIQILFCFGIHSESERIVLYCVFCMQKVKWLITCYRCFCSSERDTRKYRHWCNVRV